MLDLKITWRNNTSRKCGGGHVAINPSQSRVCTRVFCLSDGSFDLSNYSSPKTKNMQTATTSRHAVTSKKDKLIYWITTSIVMLFDAVGALAFNTDIAKEGTRHLGFPDYFRVEVSIGKIIGGIIILAPMIPKRLKEWAYVGFGISMISAFIANCAVDGWTPMLLMPVIFFVLLVVSYTYYHKLVD
jgi:hypothetical protein